MAWLGQTNRGAGGGVVVDGGVDGAGGVVVGGVVVGGGSAATQVMVTVPSPTWTPFNDTAPDIEGAL